MVLNWPDYTLFFFKYLAILLSNYFSDLIPGLVVPARVNYKIFIVCSLQDADRRGNYVC